MIIDTSALMAVLREEPEARRFTDLLLASSDNRISAATYVEAQIVALAYGGLDELLEFVEVIGAEIVPLDQHQAGLALEGFRRFGKGRHPAGLNLGDCFAYALARALDEPLLFKGDDFPKTDVRPAISRAAP